MAGSVSWRAEATSRVVPPEFDHAAHISSRGVRLVPVAPG